MKYYRLATSADEKFIGQFPQTKMIKLGDFGLEENMRLGYEQPIKKLTNPPEIQLEDGAIISDALDSIYLTYSFFLIINNNLLRLFKEVNLPYFEVFDIPVFYHKKVLEYKLFHIDYPKNDNFINFSKSSFYVGQRGKDPDYFIKIISDYEEYTQMKEKLKVENTRKHLLAKEIVLDLSDNKFDLFRLTVDYSMGYYISEKLKSKIEELKYTGFDFKEIEDVDSKIRVIY
jgi:hypothetical protein